MLKANYKHFKRIRKGKINVAVIEIILLDFIPENLNFR